ncbi:MAG TPA: glycosyltransferase family 25 protein [Gemmataceae bacterium]|jgi:hypothetical protein
MTARDYFDRVYVINLPDRPDRLRAVVRELDRAGLPLAPGRVEVFPAVRPDAAAGFPTPGSRGCFLSHLGVVRAARSAGARNVLIVEDDLAVAPQFRSSEPAVVDRLRAEDWGFVYLGHVAGPDHAGLAALVPVTKPLMTTHFVGVNGPVFDRFIAFLEALPDRPAGHADGGPMSIDGAYSTFRAQNPDVLTLMAVPNLGRQRSSRSDVAPPRWFDRAPGLRHLAAAARSAKVRLLGH